MSEQLTGPLRAMLGDAGLIAFTEAFGGQKLYVPSEIPPAHAIAQAVGPDGARKLADRYSPAAIRVPLARELRARHYRDQLKLSNAAIASRLGMTVTGVEKLFARLRARTASRNQLTLGL